MDALIDDYECDLGAVERVPKHVHDTITRIRRVINETGWRNLGDVRADEFLSWRSKLERSAKTKKEFQISINAFFNWLVSSDRLAKNPLAKIKSVETRGKQVRVARSFSEEELRRLFAVASNRKLAYQTLLYTGQRKSEVRSLVWSDLQFDTEQPHALFRASTMKDKDKRSVPLRTEIVDALKAIAARQI